MYSIKKKDALPFYVFSFAYKLTIFVAIMSFNTSEVKYHNGCPKWEHI